MDMEFNKNEDKMKLLISEMNQKLQQIHLGGGKKKIEKQHAKGKLTARERIDFLIDKNSDFLELGAFVGEGMYKEHGGCPSSDGIRHGHEMEAPLGYGRTDNH